MSLNQLVTSRLGGFKNSNPEILISFPSLDNDDDKSEELLSLCLPMGCKAEDIIIKRFNSSNLISYIFKVAGEAERDDLFSFSLLVSKGMDQKIYETVLKKFIHELREKNLLKESTFMNNQDTIYKSFNGEKDLEIEGQKIALSSFFEEVKNKNKKQKPDLKGHFFR